MVGFGFVFFFKWGKDCWWWARSCLMFAVQNTPQVTMRNSWQHGATKDYVVLSASRGFLGPKRRWSDEKPAERVSLGNHRFSSPKTYRDANNLITDLAQCVSLVFTRTVVLFQGTSTYQQTSPNRLMQGSNAHPSPWLYFYFAGSNQTTGIRVWRLSRAASLLRSSAIRLHWEQHMVFWLKGLQMK